MRTLPCVLVGLLVAAMASPVAASAASGPAVRGVQILRLQDATTPAAIDADLDAADLLGANTVRVDVSWSGLQPKRAGVYDGRYVKLLDRLVVGANERGMRVLPVILRSPCWASSSPAAPRRCADAVRWPPRRASDYAAMAAFVAARYRGRLAGLEVWNEPDIAGQFYFAGPDKPQRYAQLMRATYPAVKRADPKLPVLAGSLVGADGRFLRALYRAGMKGFYDGLAVHYYDLTLAALRAIRTVQRRAGDRKPLWLTEFGWSSCLARQRTQGGHACVTAANQARFLGDVFRALRGHSEVRAAITYQLRDDRLDFGAFSRPGERKPAFAALRSAFTGTLGRTRPLTLRASGRRISGTAPAGDVIVVTALRRSDGARRYQAIVKTDRDGRFALSLPSAVRGVKVVVNQPWTRLTATASL